MIPSTSQTKVSLDKPFLIAGFPYAVKLVLRCLEDTG